MGSDKTKASVLRATLSAERRHKIDQIIADFSYLKGTPSSATAQLRDRLQRAEKAYQSVVQSASWKVTLPMRVVSRLLRGQKPVSSFKGSAANASVSGKIHKLVAGAFNTSASPERALLSKVGDLEKARDYKGLVALHDKLLASSDPSVVERFATDLCEFLYRARFSAMAHAAEAADRMTPLLLKASPDILSHIEQDLLRIVVCRISMIYTRTGQQDRSEELLKFYEDGFDIDATVKQFRANSILLDDPTHAQELLKEALALQDPPSEFTQFLAASLETELSSANADFFPLPSPPLGKPDALIALANAILCQDDFENYKYAVNGYFGLQGLYAPFADNASAFDFDALIAPEVQSSTNAQYGPLATVIMTTHNSEATLDYAIRSILTQTYANIELFIVDDCSTDKTRSLLKKMQKKDDRIHLIFNKKNVGTYASKNQAMERAGGEFITFHDSDDWAHPERISRHVKYMQQNPEVVASRSNWLRLNNEGEFVFDRWQARYAHPNPASLFIRREVVKKCGFFDSVRYGADTEFMYRITYAFGKSRLRGMTDVLGFGLRHDASLTRSGSGNMGALNFAPTRGEYSAYSSDWFLKSKPENLYMPRVLRSRPFPAPDDMIVPVDALEQNATYLPSKSSDAPETAENDVPLYMFAITLAAKTAVKDWQRTEQLLSNTLNSLLNQSDGRFIAVVCGHDVPQVPEMSDPRVRFIRSDIPPAKDPKYYRRDKVHKRNMLGRELSRLGGGYYHFLDADDLIHRDVVRHVLSDDNRNGYSIRQGYALDFNNKRMAPVPGCWTVTYDRVCGSSGVFYFEPHELPPEDLSKSDALFYEFREHTNWPILAEEIGRPMDVFPFPAGMYVLNHGHSISFSLHRKGKRAEQILLKIEDAAIENPGEILLEDFGITPDRLPN